MMATAEEIQNYLAKRGYVAEVSEQGDSYVIGLHARTIEEVAELLTTIQEGSRFIVTTYHKDIVDLIVKDAQLEERFQAIADMFDGGLNVVRLRSDALYERINELSISLGVKTEEMQTELATRFEAKANQRVVDQKIAANEQAALWDTLRSMNDRLIELEKKPWWKRVIKREKS
jgi:hypothetical protein